MERIKVEPKEVPACEAVRVNVNNVEVIREILKFVRGDFPIEDYDVRIVQSNGGILIWNIFANQSVIVKNGEYIVREPIDNSPNFFFSRCTAEELKEKYFILE